MMTLSVVYLMISMCNVSCGVGYFTTTSQLIKQESMSSCVDYAQAWNKRRDIKAICVAGVK